MSTLLKEPLLHFLLAGALLLYAYQQLNPEADDSTHIRVDLPTMLTFVQYRSKSFEPALAKQRWEGLSATERQRLIDDYLREEILYREARQLDLQRDDYIIKRRLVQKMEFILKPATEALPVEDAALAQFYEDNQDLYLSQAHATFTHVFFKNGNKSAVELAKLRDRLNAEKRSFSDAINYGERFLYHQNYVERTKDYVASQMGVEVASQVFNVDSAQQRWLGPFSSDHGQHLLFINAVQAAVVPELDSIRGRVEHDYRRELQQQQFDKAFDALRNAYRIDISNALQ